MAQENLDVRVRLIDARLAQLEAQRTSRAISGIGKSAKKAGEEGKAGFGGLSTGIKSLLGYAGVTGLAFGIKDVTQAGLGLQAAQTRIQNSLRAVGVTGTAAYKHIQDQLEQMSTHGGGSVEEMSSGFSQFLDETHSVSAALKANEAATKLSIKTGMTYAQAQGLIASAEAGRTRGLQKYVGAIVPVKTAEQALADAHGVNVRAIDAQAKAMGKAGPAWKATQLAAAGVTKAQQAQAVKADQVATAQEGVNRVLAVTKNAHESTAQKIRDMQHAFQGMEASIGTLLIPVMNRLAVVGDNVARFLTKHKGLAIALGVALGALGTVAIGKKLIGALKDLKTVGVTSFNAIKGAAATTFEFIMANPWVLAIAAAIAVIVLLVTHFKEVKRVAIDVFNAVKGAVQSVWHFIESVATAIFNAITYPFRKAFDFIKSGFDSVKHFIKGIPLIGSFLSHGGPVGHHSHGGPIYRGLGGPSGTDTVPAWLTPGEYVLDQATTSRVGIPALQQLQAGGGMGGQDIHITIEPADVRMDSRVVAQLVLKAALNKAARGSSSLVGGSLATTGGYTSLATGAPA